MNGAVERVILDVHRFKLLADYVPITSEGKHGERWTEKEARDHRVAFENLRSLNETFALELVFTGISMGIMAIRSLASFIYLFVFRHSRGTRVSYTY